MDTSKILELLRTPHNPLPEMPTGRKDAVYFFIDSSYNAERRKQKENSQFWDDRGAWKIVASPLTLFTKIGNKLTSVKLHNEGYVTKKHIDKKSNMLCWCPSLKSMIY